MDHLKVYEIQGNTKVKRDNESTLPRTDPSTWKKCTENDILPSLCSFENCDKQSNDAAYVTIKTEDKNIEGNLFIIPTCKRCSRSPTGVNGWKPVRKETLAALEEEDNTEEPHEDCVQEK